mmetsp:Transcript_55825/g.173048  ORF Transcript_55825/g.173048 Transcript_55825/m.173048 type:complete len:216 (+) Transcript_55825:1130-1777(+)
MRSSLKKRTTLITRATRTIRRMRSTLSIEMPLVVMASSDIIRSKANSSSEKPTTTRSKMFQFASGAVKKVFFRAYIRSRVSPRKVKLRTVCTLASRGGSLASSWAAIIWTWMPRTMELMMMRVAMKPSNQLFFTILAAQLSSTSPTSVVRLARNFSLKEGTRVASLPLHLGSALAEAGSPSVAGSFANLRFQPSMFDRSAQLSRPIQLQDFLLIR